MSRRRIALIFDNTLRPETTGTYCLRALRRYADVEFFTPDQLEKVPHSGFDLYLNIDDGLRYRLPDHLRPCAWWVIDTHMDLPWAIKKGQDFDWLFAAQRDGAEQLKLAGLAAEWLPLACDPEIHRPWSVQNRWDVCFVGRVSSGPREDLLRMIAQQLPRSFVGQCYFDEYAQACSSSLIGFNRSVKNDVNMRVFETLGCGPLLITNDLSDNGQAELFGADWQLVTYRDAEELLDKLRFYLRSDVERRRIAEAGHAEVIARHTYVHRMGQILKTVQRDLNRVSVAVGGAGASAKPVRPGHTSALFADLRERVQLSWIDSVDFVIKSFLRPVALLRLMRSIEEYFPTAHVTIVDDGGMRTASDPASQACCAFIDSRKESVLIELPFASGVTPGRNRLVAQTQRPLLLFLDDDFAFTDQTNVKQLFDRLEQDPRIGVVAGACTDVIGNRRQPRNSGGTMTVNDDVLEIQTRAWRDRDAGVREYVPQFMMVRREVFHEVAWEGGIGGEHYDLCLQLMRTRWKVVHDLSVLIDHYPQTETLPGYEQFRFDCGAAQQWLLRKWALAKIVQDAKVIVERFPDSTDKATSPHHLAEGRPQKDAPYFEFARPEVVALIPSTARRVLDIGCGAGRLGQLLKQRQSVTVTGLELQPQAVALARGRLDEVLEQNVEDSSVEFAPGRFDCVVCADVLEHLREPAAVLAKIRRWLTPDGSLVLSLPNVRHHSVVSGLLDGNWTYESAGLLDNDHVRFFTRREIEKLLYRQGFEITSLVPKPGPGHAEWVASGRLGSVKVGSLHIEGLTPESAEEFFTYQFLVVARPASRVAPAVTSQRNDRMELAPMRAGAFAEPKRPGHPYGLTSIIIVTYNELGYTKECVESIRLRTDESYELIFVDNGSTDGTPQYLASLTNVQVIENRDNRGFPAAVNQGIAIARGEQILLLNNDTVVSTGWLDRMLRALHSDPQIGLVGPRSNCVSGSQMIPANYPDMASMDGFAWDWGKAHASEREETDRLIGFCLLIKRAVIDEIGVLDERFGIGCFEDDDFCIRAIRAGWKAVIARDAFVHHYGSRTFAASGIDFAGLMDENREKFAAKWAEESGAVSSGVPKQLQIVKGQVADTTDTAKNQGADAPRSPGDEIPVPERFSISEAPGGGLLLTHARPKVSLCMIVRNNETTIRPCLESIRPWVDEIIVVDTGSTDSTPRICEEIGAKVFSWAWRDDFATARNQSLEHATGEWIFWMDSDDTITPECGHGLRTLVYGEHAPDIFGYIMQVHCPGPDSDGPPDVTAVDHAKLFRNRPDLRFEHRMHEQILPAIRRAGGNVAFTDLYVVHSGSDHSEEGRARKLERDFKLLFLDLQERPDHPFVLFNLGMTYADTRAYDEAVYWLTRCLKFSSTAESHVRKTYALLVSTLYQQSRFDEASRICHEGRRLYPDDKELQFRQGMLNHQLGHLEQAAQNYRDVLSVPIERHFSSMDVGLAGYKARHNLALVYEDQGRPDRAEVEWQAILAEHPTYHAAKFGLVECLLKQRQFERAEALIDSMNDRPNQVVDRHHLMARLFEAKGEPYQALARLQQGLDQIGNDPTLLREQARLLYAARDLPSAARTLNRLTSILPNDRVAQNNLNVVMAELGHRDIQLPL